MSILAAMQNGQSAVREGWREREEAIQRPVTRTGAGGAGGWRRGGWDGADGEARGAVMGLGHLGARAVAGRAGVEACSCELDGEAEEGAPVTVGSHDPDQSRLDASVLQFGGSHEADQTKGGRRQAGGRHAGSPAC